MRAILCPVILRRVPAAVNRKEKHVSIYKKYGNPLVLSVKVLYSIGELKRVGCFEICKHLHIYGGLENEQSSKRNSDAVR